MVYFVGSDNIETSFEVKAQHVSADGVADTTGVVLIEFTTAVNAAATKCKIYPVMTPDIGPRGEMLIFPEFDRLLNIRRCTALQTGDLGTLLLHSAWGKPSNILEGGDSGKPAFFYKDGDMAVVIGGNIFNNQSPFYGRYIDEFNVIMQANHGYSMQTYANTHT